MNILKPNKVAFETMIEMLVAEYETAQYLELSETRDRILYDYMIDLKHVTNFIRFDVMVKYHLERNIYNETADYILEYDSIKQYNQDEFETLVNFYITKAYYELLG